MPCEWKTAKCYPQLVSLVGNDNHDGGSSKAPGQMLDLKSIQQHMRNPFIPMKTCVMIQALGAWHMKVR